MYEICVQQMRDALLAEQRGNRPERTGNDAPESFRQDVYPCAGDDRWIAIRCADATRWQALCGLAGGEDIAGWTAGQDAHALTELLQAAGIAAGALQDMEDLIDGDTALLDRGALVTLDHPLLGAFGHVRTPVSFSRDTVAPYRAPGLGEHGQKIAAEIAGLSPERIGELAAAGVFR